MAGFVYIYYVIYFWYWRSMPEGFTSNIRAVIMLWFITSDGDRPSLIINRVIIQLCKRCLHQPCQVATPVRPRYITVYSQLRASTHVKAIQSCSKSKPSKKAYGRQQRCEGDSDICIKGQLSEQTMFFG
jgi:hypothetical protein